MNEEMKKHILEAYNHYKGNATLDDIVEFYEKHYYVKLNADDIKLLSENYAEITGDKLVDQSAKYLCVSDYRMFDYKKDFIHEIFGIDRFRNQYSTLKLSSSSSELLWFPNLTNKEWKNELLENEMVIRETPLTEEDINHWNWSQRDIDNPVTRIVFMRDPSRNSKYRFYGVYQPEKFDTEAKAVYYKRIADKIAIPYKTGEAIAAETSMISQVETYVKELLDTARSEGELEITLTYEEISDHFDWENKVQLIFSGMCNVMDMNSKIIDQSKKSESPRLKIKYILSSTGGAQAQI